MRRFDSDGSGALCFNEFLRMVMVKPWRDLFPEEVIQALPITVAKMVREGIPEGDVFGKLAAGAAAYGVSPFDSPAQQVVKFAQGLFKEADKDGSGELDVDEFGEMALPFSNMGSSSAYLLTSTSSSITMAATASVSRAPV